MTIGRLLATRRRAVAAVSVAIVMLVAGWARLGPIDPALLDDSGSLSTSVVDRHGRPLYEQLSGEGTRSQRLAAGELPRHLAMATVAAEDHRFHMHPGLDPIAMVRALARNVRRGRVVEGGSTISQQVAKLLLNRRDPQRIRGVRAKVAEAILALRLEHRFAKDEILALYLNLAAYGNQVAGAGRASREYFGREASMLTPAQAAFLAGLPQRPSAFNPYRSREAALERQRAVLRRMEASGALTAADAKEARDERLVFTQLERPLIAPHFVEMVLHAATVSADKGTSGTIVSTLDRGLQEDVQGIIRAQRASLARHGAANVAVVVLDNATGEWLAWEGSGDYFDSAHGGAINGPVTPRQPGSALKPFTYALAFEEGFTPASVLPDIPSHFPTAEPGVLYSPRNYDGRYRGPLLARRALAGSENVPAVALASELGVPKLLRFLLRSGFSTLDRNAAYYGLGVTLGNAEVRLDELVAAYSAFARGGERLDPTFLRDTPRQRRRVVSERTAFWITDVLSDAGAREYIFGRGGSLELPFAVAVKTGTSQAYHDNWTVGYSRRVTVGVWVGNFDRTPLRDSTGVTGAAPIFHAVMLAAERRAPIAAHEDAVLAPPADVVTREICALSGMLANPWCPSRQREWLAAGASPLPCSWHHLADEGLLTIMPATYDAWAGTSPPRRPGHPSVGGGRHERAAPERLTIVSPPDGATYLIDPTLRREFQGLPLKATTAAPGPVSWSVDGRHAGQTVPGRSLSWPLATGRHRFVARDSSGREAAAVVEVR